jgi:hypothetical protein
MAARKGRTRSSEQRAVAVTDRVAQAARTASTLARRFAEAASQIPGAEQAQAQMRRVEQRVLRELKARIDEATRPALGETVRAPEEAPGISRTYVIPLLQSPRRLLDELLERSLTQTREQAEEDFYSVLLSELVPDEARILALLSDRSPWAVVHIGSGAPIGPVRTRIAENYTALGRPAQVKLLERVPLYIEHLKALGLLEEGPEDPALESKYQIIEGLRELRDAVERARGQSRTSMVRLLRRTLRLSELGDQLWRACTGGPGGASAPAFKALQ